MTLFTGLGSDVYVTGEESGLLWEHHLALQNAVEWRMVMARSPEERARMHSVRYLLNTCEGMSNRELDEGARWIQGLEEEQRDGAGGHDHLRSCDGTRETRLERQKRLDCVAQLQVWPSFLMCSSSSGPPVTVWKTSG